MKKTVETLQKALNEAAASSVRYEGLANWLGPAYLKYRGDGLSIENARSKLRKTFLDSYNRSVEIAPQQVWADYANWEEVFDLIWEEDSTYLEQAFKVAGSSGFPGS